MSKLALTVLMLLIFSIAAFSQMEKYTTPTVWEDYSIKDKDITVQMPKLPVLQPAGNSCRGEETSQYYAYSDGVVYVLSVTSKTKVPEYCREKKSFDKENFNERVQSLRNEYLTARVTENLNDIIFTDEYKTYKLVNDYKNKRWVELQVFGADENKTEVKNFLESLKIGANAGGKEIGKGAVRNYGDANIVEARSDIPEETSAESTVLKEKKDIVGLKIIAKPRASYTDAARQASIQGTVRLRVTFLANGGIGSIALISGLPYGLTEQGIFAASRMFFIPAKKKGKPFSVTKIVEYNFSIY